MGERRSHDTEMEDLVRGKEIVERSRREALGDAVRANPRNPIESIDRIREIGDMFGWSLVAGQGWGRHRKGRHA